jgi:hypothetical protein
MKANELMIGDWLKHYNGTPMQVTKITTEHFACAENGGANCWEYNNKYEPILITLEILKKNGLANDPYGCHFKEDEYMELEISAEEEGIYWTINYNEYGILKLKYVHQLQHALRLCGINKEIVV